MALPLSERNARRGTANPEVVACAHWEHLVRTGESAWAANRDAGGPSSMVAGPVWAFERFGMATVELPDGRTLHIAGEHEDWYDPDFWIYNDVVVQNPDGTLVFWLYPVDVLPPTDFHSATLVDHRVVLIGSLGYVEERRPGTTPIAVLDVRSGAVTPMRADGDGPGWIHRHEARLDTDASAILVERGVVVDADGEHRENVDVWRLDLQTWRWTRLTARTWPSVALRRADGARTHLWEMRQWLWNAANPGFRSSVEYPEPPDRAALEALYAGPWGDAQQGEDDAFNVWNATVDGVTVRFVEDDREVTLHIEGDHPPATVDAWVAHLAGTLARALGAEIHTVRLR